MSSVPKLPANHVSRVTRLYRHALKNLMNWAVHRDLFVQRGFALRAEFDANKSVTDPKLVELIVSKGEKKLAEFTHPDPYTRELPPSETCRPNIVFAIASLIARDTRCADSAGPPRAEFACHAPTWAWIWFGKHAPTHLQTSRSLPPCLPQCRTCPAGASTCAIQTTAWDHRRRCAYATPRPCTPRSAHSPLFSARQRCSYGGAFTDHSHPELDQVSGARAGHERPLAPRPSSIEQRIQREVCS